jgi:hypothetical protein
MWEPWAWSGGSKDERNTGLMPYLAAKPDVLGFVRFQLWKEAERRINSSASSASGWNARLLARGS